MNYIVYKITNIVNNKIYIGIHKTKNIDDGYFGSGSLLKKAIEKYGKLNFVLDILYYCNSEQQMLDKERDLIKEYNSTDKKIGYNMSPGQGGYCLSEEGRKKISIFNKGKKLSQSHMEKLKNPKNEKTKQKFKEAQRLRRLNQPKSAWYHEPLTNISKQIFENESIPLNWVKGRGKTNYPKTIKMTEEGRLSKAIANKNLDKRKKISKTLKGHLVSQETRDKISKTLKEKYETSINPNNQ